MSTDGTGDTSEHLANSIQRCKDTQHVRLRPEMYIGDVGIDGLHHLVWELVKNSTEEHLEGNGTAITVELMQDGGCRVSDNGSGIPLNDGTKLASASLGWAFCQMSSTRRRPPYLCGKDGLRGRGLPIVCALSERCIGESRKDGKVWRQTFGRGEAVSDLELVGQTPQSGSSVSFWPDPEIFLCCDLNAQRIRYQCQKWAYVHRGLSVCFRDQRSGERTEEVFCYPPGDVKYLSTLQSRPDTVHPHVFTLEVHEEPFRLEVVAEWVDQDASQIRPYVNSHFTIWGGTHVTGFRAATAEVLNRLTSHGQIANRSLNAFEPEDCLGGISALVHVQGPESTFGPATLLRLYAEEVEAWTRERVQQGFLQFLHDHPEDAKLIHGRVELARIRREQLALVRRARRRLRSDETGRSLH